MRPDREAEHSLSTNQFMFFLTPGRKNIIVLRLLFLPAACYPKTYAACEGVGIGGIESGGVPLDRRPGDIF